MAALGASVTLVSGDPTSIYPGESTRLEITLSNSNTAASITGVAFSNTLPGTLPNGLKVAGAATYTCTDPAVPVTNAGVGTLTAAPGTQAITLSGGDIPARANGTDGTCTIQIPVTAGTSTGNAASYTYTIAGGAVTGNDGGAVSNAGAVSQSINVTAIARPTLSKAFSNSTADLGGATRTLSITLTNTNPVSIPNFSITDAFPQLGGTAIIKVAATPAATASCNNGGGAPTFAPLAGATSVSASGTIPARVGATNGSCTLSVAVEANHTNGLYSTGAQTNTINASSDFSNDLGIPAAANATADITARSPLSVSKAFAHAALSSGQSDTFTITLSNSGSSPLNVVSFTDDPIDGTAAGNLNAYGLKVTGSSTTCAGGSTAATVNATGVTLTGGTIPAGGSCAVNVTFTGIAQSAGVPITYTNSIAAGAVNVGNPALVSQSASASILVADDLRVLKSATPATAAPGNPVRYQVTVQNYGVAAINNLVVNDTLPAGMTYLTGVIGANDYTPTLSGTGCVGLSSGSALGDASAVLTVGTLPGRSDANTPGACVVTFWAMVATNAADGASTANSLGVGAVCYNAGASCNGAGSGATTGSVNTTVLTAVKAFSPAGPLPEGTISTLTITLGNTSANPLTNVSISDTLPTSGSGQLRIANPANASSTCGSPTITATPGSTSIAMNGGTVPARAGSGTGASGSCLLSVDVVGPAGSYPNTATAGGTETYANGSTHLVGPVSSNTATLVYSSALSASKSFAPTAVSSGGRATLTVRVSNSGSIPLTGLAITDPLPAGMVVANPAQAYTTCAGATSITATPGASSASLSGASLAGGGSCEFIFDVVASGAANWVNTIPAGNITADAGVINTTPVIGTLNFQAPTSLTVAKSTSPSTLTFPGQTSVLSLTITSGTQAVSNLSLTDYFTADGTSGAAVNGMVIAATPAAGTTCPGGVVSATPGAASVSLTGVSLAASTSCVVNVNVTSTTVGGITNFIPAGAVQNDQGLSNAFAAQTSLTTQANIGVTKQFLPAVVKPGERSRLRITFYNATATPLTFLAVTDTLPGGVSVPAGANPTSTCLGAVVTAPAANQVQVANGTVPAASGGVAATCQAEIDVLVVAQGDYTNTIPAGGVTANAGGATASNSQPASAVLRAKSPLIIHEAITNLTLDAGNPVGFTTGGDITSPGTARTLTIRLDNPNNAPLTGAAFTNALPAGLVLAPTPNASTTCAGGTVLAAASGTSLRLSGATIPATGACTVTVDVLSNISGVYVDSIAAGDVSTNEGVGNEEPTSAQLTVSKLPTLSKQFNPAVIPPGGTSVLTLFLGNDNASAITLSSALTDTLPTAPGAIVVATPPNVVKTCPGAVTAVAGAGTVSYANGAAIPAGGCTISVDVIGTTPGVHNNNIPAGALQTSVGNNPEPANASLTVSTLGYISGKVFKDNNVTPNGSFDSGTDVPVTGESIELRAGPNCSGALLATAITDALGNYLFSGLGAGTYSVCQPSQPAGTSNGTTSAGPITSVNGSTGTAGAASNPTAGSSLVAGIVLNADGAGGEISGSAGNNFAEVAPSRITGTVFLDQNNNGAQNGADTGISGVVVELLDAGNSVVASTTTDASGNYSFSGLQPGTYSIRQPTQPAGTSNGITTAGGVGNGGSVGTASAVTTAPSLIAGIVLPPNTTATGNNFAEIPNGRALSGRVFLDFDAGGTVNGNDHGIGGVTINLTGTDINGNPVSRTTSTASDGSYSFTGLPEGTYTLSQPGQAAGTSNGTTTAGSTGGVASNPTATTSQITGISLVGADTVSADNNFAELAGAAPDLSIAKSHAPASFAQSGTTGFYTLTPGNIGTVATSGTVTLVDTLPAGITPTAAAGTGWTCGIAGQVVTCTSTASIGPGASGNPIILNVSVAAGLAGQVLVNTATISGGGEPSGFTGNNTATDPTPIAGVASVQGRVWRDLDHDGVLDGGEPLVADWVVELVLSGQIVATTTTAANGAYAFNNLAPGSGYSIRFLEPGGRTVFGRPVPNESGGAFVNGATGPNNPAGADNSQGILSGLTLLEGASVAEQSLPLDPAGVVYDAVTRQPVAGATITLSGPPGFNAGHVVGGSLTQTTGAGGLYQFLLNPGAPNGVYTLTVTTYPAGYVPLPSTLIPACAGTPAVGAAPAPALIQSSNTAPPAGVAAHNPAACDGIVAGGSATTQYFQSFNLNVGVSANVLNNHIPLDPILGGAIVMSKTTPLVNVSKGDLVPYTITARNTLAAALGNITLQDQVPPGFKYKSGSARLNGVAVEPMLNGRLLSWPNQTFAANETKTLRLMLVVGAGVGDGEYTNQTWALNSVVNSQVSNTATATVRVVPDPTFDCSDLIGKVFDDRNANGYQDEGEPGIADVRLATARGLLVTTDAEGRFHVTCAQIPQAQRGSNFIMKLDERTLPSGYRITTENPREVRMTRGKLVKLNFGAAIHRVVRLELAEAAFQAGKAEPGPALAEALSRLPETLSQRPSVMRLAYRIGEQDADMAPARLKAVRQAIETLWRERGCCYTLQFEEELFRRASGKRDASREGGVK
ncbi:MAG TPA: SdrD B-like domain-containing protein [Rhodocyclaceae bacterium]|nr:SdrD B-like domain-containing protein [Rhodocyclaceae bacterium]